MLRQSPDRGAGGELRDLEFLPGLSPGQLRQLAHLISSHHDAGGDPATLIPDARDVELSFAGREYRLERKGERFSFSDRSLGEKDYGPPREVVLLTGSHTLQILWIETGQGRTLEQFPFAYIIAEKMWAPVTQTFLMPPETKEAYSIGSWNGACMDCHVTQGMSNFVEGNKWDTKVAEFGIACEACHSEGPRTHRGQPQSAPALETSPDEGDRPHDREREEDEGTGVGPGLRAMPQRLGFRRDGGEDRFQPPRREVSPGQRRPGAAFRGPA